MIEPRRSGDDEQLHRRQHNTRPGPSSSVNQATVDRFWSNVDRSAGHDACWPWTGTTDPDGYGLGPSVDGKTTRAHRFACILTHGAPPTKGLSACHSTKCTTRACCNGDHLRWDTNAGNQADVAIVGTRRGTRNPKAKLNEDLVRLIWSRRAEGPTVLSRELGLGRSSVRHVIDGTNWGHVTASCLAATPDAQVSA